jgi:two-component system response regulator LytT
MIRAVVVDDEPLAREEITYLISRVGGVEVVGEADSGIRAIEVITKERPDVVFLDIQMPGLDGLEVSQLLRAMEGYPYIIFVTAYDRYALRAFETFALDYLLKPVDINRLASAITRAKDQIELRRTDYTRKIEEFFKTFRTPLPKLTLRRGNKIILLDPAEVIYFTIKEGVVLAITAELEGMLNYRSLDDLTEDLGGGPFFRAHRSFLVNLNEISQISRAKSGTHELIMSNRTIIPLSRKHTQELRKIIKW